METLTPSATSTPESVSTVSALLSPPAASPALNLSDTFDDLEDTFDQDSELRHVPRYFSKYDSNDDYMNFNKYLQEQPDILFRMWDQASCSFLGILSDTSDTPVLDVGLLIWRTKYKMQVIPHMLNSSHGYPLEQFYIHFFSKRKWNMAIKMLLRMGNTPEQHANEILTPNPLPRVPTSPRTTSPQEDVSPR